MRLASYMGWMFCSVSLFAISPIVLAQESAAEEEYSNLLESEVEKLNSSGEATVGVADSVGRKEFELLLEEEFHGSWVFYQKLPEATKGEVYDEFTRTGSIRSARSMIMSRFLKK